MKCLSCGNEIDESLFPSGLAFCPYCGDSLPAADQGQDIERISFCPYCGQELISQANFCPHCGQQLLTHDIAPSGEYEGKAVEREGKEFIGRAAAAIKSTFGPERKAKKLYRQWTEHSGLPPEEIPSLAEAARHTALEEAKESKRFPVLYIVLAAAVLFFIAGIILLVMHFSGG